jgi:hypothetical protein
MHGATTKIDFYSQDEYMKWLKNTAIVDYK